jgi:hypothetical protein
MDLLQELRRKVSEIDPHDKVDGINAAIRHIELADRFLSRARSEHDPDLFNDVIYRTNQAFEGMLKKHMPFWRIQTRAVCHPMR